MKQDGISILELCLPPPSNMKFQIWFTIWISLEKKFGAIVSWVLNTLLLISPGVVAFRRRFVICCEAASPI